VAKKKKKNQHKTELAASALSARESFWTPRRSVILCVAALCLLWFIQFYSVLTGGGNLWEDVIQLEYPYRYFTRMAFFQFEFPHWNPFTFGGMPFFATGAGVFYPFSAILSLLPVGDAAFWRLIQAVIVLHILIAGITMFVYLRFKGRSDTASLFGAVAFMFSGYMITHIIHLSIIGIAAWLPLLLLLLERGIRENKPKYAVIGGLILGAVMQMGHAQVMFYTIIFLLAYSAFFIFQSKDQLVKRIAVTSYFFVIAAGLCLVQYLPVFEASGQTSRIEYTIKEASEGSLQFVQLLTAFLPKLFGAYTGNDSIPRFWLEDAFRHGYWNYWETSFYFGISTLILSLLLFRKIKTDRSLILTSALTLVSFVVALGGNFFVYKLLFSMGIPGFNSFRHTPRILFVWIFLFPMMAAAVLDSLDELKSKKLQIASLLLCAFTAILGIITITGGLQSIFPLMGAAQERAQYASQQGYVLLVNALLFGFVLILFFINKINAKTAKVLIVACLVIDMLIFAAGQHITNRDGADKVFAKAKNTVEQIKNMPKGEIFRVNTRQFIVNSGEKIAGQTGFMIMERNQGYVSGIEIVEGYNPFRLKYASLPLNAEKFDVMLDLMNVRHYVNPRFNQGDANVILENRTYLPRAKLFYKAKVVSAEDSLILNYMNSASYNHRNEIVVTDQSFSKFTGNSGKGKAEITKYKLNKIEVDVDTDHEAILWMSEIWYPAWKATVNGKKTEVYRANHSFRAVVVPAGNSKVVFKFSSTAFNIGAIISLLTLVAAVAYLLMQFRRGGNLPPAPSPNSSPTLNTKAINK
jgi:uncharacterized membrane protein YfhO